MSLQPGKNEIFVNEYNIYYYIIQVYVNTIYIQVCINKVKNIKRLKNETMYVFIKNELKYNKN